MRTITSEIYGSHPFYFINAKKFQRCESSCKIMPSFVMFASVEKLFSLGDTLEKSYAEDASLNLLKEKSKIQLPNIKCSILMTKL